MVKLETNCWFPGLDTTLASNKGNWRNHPFCQTILDRNYISQQLAIECGIMDCMSVPNTVTVCLICLIKKILLIFHCFGQQFIPPNGNWYCRLATSSHYSDVIMGAMVRCLKSPALRLFQPFIQAQIEENIKAPHHWPLCGEFPAQMASNW